MAYISDQGALMTCDGGWYHAEAVAICVCAFGSKRAGGERPLRNVVYGLLLRVLFMCACRCRLVVRT
uniref:Uncharacterized protein n=1 Tax=Hyaloperonospora arabidopsidis (strain Emoy2) TaxID=559515 RepID=M4BXQ4_HYAAE